MAIDSAVTFKPVIVEIDALPGATLHQRLAVAGPRACPRGRLAGAAAAAPATPPHRFGINSAGPLRRSANTAPVPDWVTAGSVAIDEL